jgi:hypothetical protein
LPTGGPLPPQHRSSRVRRLMSLAGGRRWAHPATVSKARQARDVGYCDSLTRL